MKLSGSCCRDALEFAFNTLAFVLLGGIIAARCGEGFAGSNPILVQADYGWTVAVWLLLLVRGQSASCSCPC